MPKFHKFHSLLTKSDLYETIEQSPPLPLNAVNQCVSHSVSILFYRFTTVQKRLLNTKSCPYGWSQYNDHDKYVNSIIALALSFTRNICVLRYISTIMWKTLKLFFFIVSYNKTRSQCWPILWQDLHQDWPRFFARCGGIWCPTEESEIFPTSIFRY